MNTPFRPLFAIATAGALVAALGCAQLMTQAEPDEISKVGISTEVIQLIKDEGKVNLAEDDRIRCYREMALGTHIAKIKCYTVEEMDQSRRESQERMMRIQNKTGPSAEGG